MILSQGHVLQTFIQIGPCANSDSVGLAQKPTMPSICSIPDSHSDMYVWLARNHLHGRESRAILLPRAKFIDNPTDSMKSHISSKEYQIASIYVQYNWLTVCATWTTFSTKVYVLIKHYITWWQNITNGIKTTQHSKISHRSPHFGIAIFCDYFVLCSVRFV